MGFLHLQVRGTFVPSFAIPLPFSFSFFFFFSFPFLLPLYTYVLICIFDVSPSRGSYSAARGLIRPRYSSRLVRKFRGIARRTWQSSAGFRRTETAVTLPSSFAAGKIGGKFVVGSETREIYTGIGGIVEIERKVRSVLCEVSGRIAWCIALNAMYKDCKMWRNTELLHVKRKLNNESVTTYLFIL